MVEGDEGVLPGSQGEGRAGSREELKGVEMGSLKPSLKEEWKPNFFPD